MMKVWCTGFGVLIGLCSLAQTTLIPAGSSWKYLDNGVDMTSSGWTQVEFDDAAWAQGNAELGFGDGDENTVTNSTANGQPVITQYFRKLFAVTNPGEFTQLTAELVRDDGAVVYLNGVEVARSNMPAGPVGYATLASSRINWPNENDWHVLPVSAGLLQTGLNVIAVEVHQYEASSSDLSFNFRLSGQTAPLNAQINRGPYLQLATQDAITIRWRTTIPTDSYVRYGAVSGNLNLVAYDPVFKTEHEIRITGLTPATRYYYGVGYSSQLVATGANHFMETLPIEGTPGSYRFWVVGDAGMGNANQRAVRDSYLNFNNGGHADGWIMLGDNAYESGFDSEYQAGLFENMYEQILENTVAWPSPGNHDYNNHLPFSPAPAYYNIFTLPAQGEAGGIPSGTEKYYSWNFGNVHFISLDSYDESRSPSGPMAQWLIQDLEANTLPWVIAYWHHPPYTKGSHDSDNPFLIIDPELPQMRENIVPILEQYGVDLVLNGHSHCYERSYLINGHYGKSNTLTADMILDGGSGDYPAACAYHKPEEKTPNAGAVYSVVGCSGKLSGIAGSWPHPIMYSATNQHLGSMIIDVNDLKLDAFFVTSSGEVYDHFTLMKRKGQNSAVEVCPDEFIELHTSWGGEAIWVPGNHVGNSIWVAPTENTTYIAYDAAGCLADTIQLTLLSTGCDASVHTWLNDEFCLIPNPADAQQKVRVCWPEAFNTKHIRVFDAKGQLTKQLETAHQGNSIDLDLNGLQPGMFLLILESESGITHTHKLILQSN
jgi:acid phosphatase type 7